MTTFLCVLCGNSSSEWPFVSAQIFLDGDWILLLEPEARSPEPAGAQPPPSPALGRRYNSSLRAREGPEAGTQPMWLKSNRGDNLERKSSERLPGRKRGARATPRRPRGILLLVAGVATLV